MHTEIKGLNYIMLTLYIILKRYFDKHIIINCKYRFQTVLNKLLKSNHNIQYHDF